MYPLENNILVRPFERQSKSAGGIVLPDNPRNQTQISGEVIAAGPGRHDSGTFIDNPVELGDSVLIQRSHAVEIDIELVKDDLLVLDGGEKLYVIDSRNVLLIL